ncbi:MAG: serine hydroxymethyltransferase, partial [Candidatus Bathyarchaeia archaeon]
MIDELLNLVKEHEQWRGQKCLNLIPSENVMSPAVRSLLSSDLGHRYTSRDGFYMGTRFIDEIEQYGEELAKNLFGCETADLRPLSGHVANLIFLACFTQPNDTLLCVSPNDGGYPGSWEHGLSRLLKLRTVGFPFSKEARNIKVEEAKNLILQKKPKMVVFGASIFLFPHPLQELTKAASEAGAHVGYDGSHVLGLIAGGKFQDPLREGAPVLYGSTHKTFFGPQGGIILADKEHGEPIQKRVHPEFVDNAHWNRIAALTLALAEMKTYGKEYARQVIQNAQTLAKALAEQGFPVACPQLGYTQSHQVILDYGGYKKGGVIARKLEKANIIVDSGVRLGVCEATRRGMKENEMLRIAVFMERVVVDGEDPRRVKEDVMKLAEEFQGI